MTQTLKDWAPREAFEYNEKLKKFSDVEVAWETMSGGWPGTHKNAIGWWVPQYAWLSSTDPKIFQPVDVR